MDHKHCKNFQWRMPDDFGWWEPDYYWQMPCGSAGDYQETPEADHSS
jgi:hypothetical protein